MIALLSSPQSAAQWCEQRRKEKNRIGYVPTMGALHAGHISLVARSVRENAVTCASIFINPLQFENPDDLKKYPQNIEQDIEVLQRAGCDMVYTGSLQQFFPQATDMRHIKMQHPGVAGQGLEGISRVGHLEGVVTIVERLFHTTGSCSAYFGEKDYQQTLVVRHLAHRLRHQGLHINVITCPTIRESCGLAMSSRNQRLNAPQKQIASRIYQALSQAKASWHSGEHNPSVLQQQMRQKLTHPHIAIDYVAVRDQDNWSADTPTEITHARALVAAHVGEVRLIDNLYLGKR